MWMDLFQHHILVRGMDYFVENSVKSVHVKDNIIEASVYGTEEYKVEIIKDNDEVINLKCNCPYAKGGSNCKHMAAVLFYLEEKENILTKKDISKDIDNLLE